MQCSGKFAESGLYIGIGILFQDEVLLFLFYDLIVKNVLTLCLKKKQIAFVS